MSEESAAVRLINTSSRPVELHLDSGVVIIAGQEEMTCRETDLANPQVKVLTDRGVLRVQPPAEPATGQEPQSAGGRTRGSGRGSQRN